MLDDDDQPDLDAYTERRVEVLILIVLLALIGLWCLSQGMIR